VGIVNIDQVLITPLQTINKNDGNVMHGLKSSDKGYHGFGEAYFSWINEGAIKAWKRHTKMTMNLIVPIGDVRFVFFDPNKNRFRIEEIGQNRYSRLTVPPTIWFGFQCLSFSKSLVLNLANISHDPNEVERLEISDIKYPWEKL